MPNNIIIVGASEPTNLLNEQKQICNHCNNPVYLLDDQPPNATKYICTKCFSKMNKRDVTVIMSKRCADLFGMSENEINKIVNEIIQEESRLNNMEVN